MKRVAAWTAVALGLAVAGTAAADWEYTKWGMKPDQVTAASKGAVKAVPVDAAANIRSMQRKAIGAYKAGSVEYEAQFYFDVNDKLTAVRLQAKNPADCDAILAETVRRLGPPRAPRQPTWIDMNGNQIVSQSDERAGGGACSVLYEML